MRVGKNYIRFLKNMKKNKQWQRFINMTAIQRRNTLYRCRVQWLADDTHQRLQLTGTHVASQLASHFATANWPRQAGIFRQKGSLFAWFRKLNYSKMFSKKCAF